MSDHQPPALWLWPNLLAFEAPLIAVVWQHFLGRCFQAPPGLAERIVLALAVWAIYLGDRLLDTRAAVPATPRHQFCHRHRQLAAGAMGIALVAAAGLTWCRLDDLLVRNGLLLGAGTMLYMAVFSLLRLTSVVPKKAAAAGLFTAGICLVALSRLSFTVAGLALPALALFGLLLGNLFLTETWEKSSPAGGGWLWLTGLAVTAAFVGNPWFLGVAACSAALAALDLLRRHIPAAARCVLADLAMLLPMFLSVK